MVGKGKSRRRARRGKKPEELAEGFWSLSSSSRPCCGDGDWLECWIEREGGVSLWDGMGMAEKEGLISFSSLFLFDWISFLFLGEIFCWI
jgi:hypothetical protein